MTRLDAGRTSLFLRQQRGQLTRIWRLGRAAARPSVFPGLLDALVEPFFERCADVLAGGGAPEEVWRGLGGLLRWPPALAPAELSQEWLVVREVLVAACESVNAAPAVAEWLGRAAAHCVEETVALGKGAAPPPGIVTAVVYSSVEPRHVPADAPGA